MIGSGVEVPGTVRPSSGGTPAAEAPIAVPAPASPRPTLRLSEGPRSIAKGLVGALGAIALWELLRLVGVLPESIVPSTWTIASTLVSELASGELSTPFRQTLVTWGLGMLATIAVAVPLGVLVGLSRWADVATSLIFDVLRPVPAVAFVPVAVVLLGLGVKMQVPLVVLAAMWPLLYNTRYGVRNVDPAQLDSGRSVGLGRFAMIRRVVLPSALPAVLTGLRLSASIAVVVAIVTELVAAATGLGQYINLTQQAGLYAEAFAGILLAALFGCAVNAGTVLLESRAIAWHRGMNKRRD